MQLTQTNVDGLNHEYEIVVSAAEVSDKISNRLKELQQTVRINGFRPGRVPISILRQRYVSSVMGEVLEKVVGETSQQALKDEGVRPALQPRIEIKSFEEDHDLEYVMQVEVLPEIEAPDLKALKFTRMKVETTEEEVESAVERLAERNRAFSEVKRKRKSKIGEVLVIDFSATVNGESLKNARGENFNLALGANSFLPGFDEQLVGAKEGEEHSINVILPDSYPDPSVQGKEAVFEVAIKKHLEPEDLTITDELAKGLGLEDLAALKEATRGELERGYNSQSRTRLKRDVLDTFAKSHDFEVPQGMVDQEFEGIWLQIEQDMQRAGTSWENEKQTEEEARVEYHAIATRRVRLALLLSEIGRQNNVVVPQEELNQAVMDQARRYPGKEQEVLDYFKGHPEAISGIHAPIFEDKVIDFIIEMSDVSEAQVSLEELYQNPEERQSIGSPSLNEKDIESSKQGSKGVSSKTRSAKVSGGKNKSSIKSKRD
ncbi:MAG: Trigger factor [Alphaproteobacteria bacterium MarineAlpha9_Bin7]|nr:MAG: Trigger factor [Alphaproteobacteria bacterium MarineAlpha9_Bin7]